MRLQLQKARASVEYGAINADGREVAMPGGSAIEFGYRSGGLAVQAAVKWSMIKA